MLDDLRLIHERDKDDALGMAEKQWQQLLFRFNVNLAQIKDFENILLCIAENACTATNFIYTLNNYSKPVTTSQINQDMPSFVNSKSLCVIVDYAGESGALEALRQAEIAKAQIIVVSQQGELVKKATKDGYCAIEVPEAVLPEFASLFLIKALATIFDKLKLTKGLSDQIEQSVEMLQTVIIDWRPDNSQKNNLAKKLALDIAGKTALINSGPMLLPVANHLKSKINLCAKNLAWVAELPSNSDFIGWTGQPLSKPYAVLEFRSELESSIVNKFLVTAERLLSGKRPATYLIEPKGSTIIEQLLWGIVFADFVAIYLAFLNGFNPLACVDNVQKLDTELKDRR